MYEHQENLIRQSEHLIKAVFDPSVETYTIQECGESALYNMLDQSQRLVVYAYGIALLRDVLHIVESQEREIDHLRDERDVVRKVGDEMAVIIAEKTMYPPYDPPPPF